MLKSVSGINSIECGQYFYFMDGIIIQYSSNYTMLRWVSPQTITIWLIMILLLRHKERIENYVFLLLPGILYGTLAFVGILPIAFGYAVENLIKTQNVKKWFARIFSIENIGTVLTEGIVFVLYFYGNVTGEKPKEIGFMSMPYSTNTIIIYLVFVVVNVLLYAIVLWKKHKGDGIYYASVITLVILPLFKMGKYNDLVMRASISALFVLMVYILEYANSYLQGDSLNLPVTRKIAEMVVMMLLFSGMYYPFQEMSSSVQMEDFERLGIETDWDSLETYANRNLEVDDDIKYNYYSYDIEENIFYKFVARTK